MITVKTKLVKLSGVHLNPDNPRQITEKSMARLIKSLQEFPEMLQLREIVVDETMTVLGGNMRLRALQAIGEKECTAKIVSGLTALQKREFVIKDNTDFGDFDFDILANSWDDLPLAEWGVDLPVFPSPGDSQESDGMVPDKDPNILVRLSFHPGLWLGKREEIMAVFDKMEKAYECTVKVEE